MRKVKLGDICEALSDGLHAAPKFNPMGEYLFVNATNLEDGFIVDKGEGKRSDRSEYEKYRIDLNERTILYSIDGTIGNMARYHGEKVILGKGACYIKLDGSVDTDYIYYLLQGEHFKGYLKTMATGSTIHHISLETMRDYPLPKLPSISIQRSVGRILRSLDDKIANNKKLMAELEQTAQLIYDYWFTQFDFPDENGKPYRSSGGKMVWNDKLKREIPVGWSVGILEDYLCLEKKSVIPIAGKEYEHYSIPAFDNGKYPSFDDGKCIESNKYSVDEGCILYSKLNPKFKRLWRPYGLTDAAVTSTEFLVMRPKLKTCYGFCLGVLNSDAYYAYMLAKATSSTGSRSRVDPNEAIGFVLPHPSNNLVEEFNDVIMPFYDRAHHLEIETHQLATLRDWLLPMLMNGQATVSE
ncbi:restriction endonuclease subunit S [Enorma sp.]|uniref:restriction endonuclease subunit S n=1 Tax=Enorma sp. TaxID=1920692 RepID=UPI003AB113E4